MNALRIQTNEERETGETGLEGVVDAKEFSYYVFRLDGTVEEIAPVTGLRLTRAQIVFVLGEIVVARIPRREVYRVSRDPDMPSDPC